MEKITKNTKLIRKVDPIIKEKAAILLRRYLDACQIHRDNQSHYFDPTQRQYLLFELIQGAIFTGAQLTLIELSQELGSDFFNQALEN